MFQQHQHGKADRSSGKGGVLRSLFSSSSTAMLMYGIWITFATMCAINCYFLFDNSRHFAEFENNHLPFNIVSSSSSGIKQTDQFQQKQAQLLRQVQEQEQQRQQQLATYPTLQCEGVSTNTTQEMVYWQDIPSDMAYSRSYQQKPTTPQQLHQQYMTFEPAIGGWNNMRMAMETIVGLAIATGRTLVLPPAEYTFLLMNKDPNGYNQESNFTFHDFFPLAEMSRRNAGFTMVSMEEFLQTVAMTGNLRNSITGRVEYPPYNNRTNWDHQHDVHTLYEWLRNVTHVPMSWIPHKCMAAFSPTTSSTNSSSIADLNAIKEQALQNVQQKYLVRDKNEVVSVVDASPSDRLRDTFAKRKELCLYDTPLQTANVLHFMCDVKLGVRYLIQFYAFIYYVNVYEDLWSKRIMRDNMRYVDTLQCYAIRIITKMRQIAKENGNANGDFDTFHIRRDDFQRQYKKTEITSKQIYENTKDFVAPNTTIFIATDEKNRTLFNDLTEDFHAYYLADFDYLLKDIKNPNYYGMIDQLVASRGRRFFGCQYSSFTSYITRLRGYHSMKDNAPGSEYGLLYNSYYNVFVEDNVQFMMHDYAPIQQPFFVREFPTSWRQLNAGVGHLPASTI